MANNNWENYRTLKNWRARATALVAAIFALGAGSEVWHGNYFWALVSAGGTALLVQYMANINQTNTFGLPPPKPAPAQAK